MNVPVSAIDKEILSLCIGQVIGIKRIDSNHSDIGFVELIGDQYIVFRAFTEGTVNVGTGIRMETKVVLTKSPNPNIINLSAISGIYVHTNYSFDYVCKAGESIVVNNAHGDGKMYP